MKWAARRRHRREPTLGVVVPAYGVEHWLPESLDSLLSSSHHELDVVVVDDGSPDASGEIAEEYAARDARVRVVHTDNGGLGAARNVGTAHVRGDYLTFLDSDDVVPASAYATLVGELENTGSDFATGSIFRWEAPPPAGAGLHEPPWMHRLHNPARRGITAREHPEILGDVFAWNKVFRRSFWDEAGLAWPEGVRYEDQPTTTRAYLSGRFDVLPNVVYHWRIRTDGTSITQQRSSLQDLTDRWETKRMSLAAVREYDDPSVSAVFLDRVLAGDLHRYFTAIPGCDDAWWELLVSGARELWGDRSLVLSGLPPVHRLTGWLVEQDRRADAAAVMDWIARVGAPAPQTDRDGVRCLDVPAEVLDPTGVDPAALAIRAHERA
ncbi:glycosyltransferase family 2 protein [Nocardioides sp. InS609-2]|uniref:glycosyltransferase family 2 protein n=1 Tax=Nocardioides sp. InS609-2 TaxID=2760705 RepID=UPI0020BD5A24|nr:glycosyltransferase family 2 protein [Nocardioides sp. InS609-2]